MRKIKDILRLHTEQRLSIRQIARSLSVAYSSVSDLLHRAQAAGFTWPMLAEMDDGDLERVLYRGNQGRPRSRPEPDWQRIDTELRHKGVTLELLWLEYKRTQPDGCQYAQFCVHYRRWRQRIDVVLRQPYRAGEKLFVDYAGQTLPIIDRRTGKIRHAQLFVAVLGATHYTYAEAQWAQDLASWIGGHCRALAFFGGVPEIVVPDNLKAGVHHPCWYEPDLNPTYADWAAHYGTIVLPARPRHPRDRAKVEVGVQVVERWILPVLRHHTFSSLAEANAAIRELLDRLNARAFKKRDGSRRILFEALDHPALRPLPATPYEFAQWKQAKVNIDHHVAVEANYYTVPYQLIREEVDVRLTARTVEIFARVGGWRAMPGATGADTIRPIRPTGPRRTSVISIGRPLVSSAGLPPSARTRRRLSKRSCKRSPIPSRAIAPVWASSGSGNTIPASAWRRRSERWAPVRTRTAASSRSSSTASTS